MSTDIMKLLIVVIRIERCIFYLIISLNKHNTKLKYYPVEGFLPYDYDLNKNEIISCPK